MNKHLLSLACAALLSACGGGGSNGEVASTDPIDRYIGTWSRTCDRLSAEAISDLNGKNTNIIETIKFEKASSVKATFVYTIRVFANADTQCAAQPIATLITTGLNNSSLNISKATATMTTGFGVNELTYLAPQTLGSVSVDKVTVSSAVLTKPTGQYTVGGAIVRSEAPEFEAGSNFAFVKFKSPTGVFFNRFDAGAVPTVMDENPRLLLTKQ